ncbi:hypothetical protein CU098_013793 [Rhizopus stolonifer]|uniref:MHYT domain-containing protein n=1 Tax=Rhizopus stolonifer TaxID=4846 RepID=A0A367KYE3_RHIST|nr:hypothetical protein CU098_013793 [Rhizopus stolonifer]
MDDQIKPAIQTYNGGIIFVSYLTAVVGAMTALELLQRRTHIRGYYNWFLLSAAAASMGGVGIWSMHLIGNNSLTITLENNTHYQLLYSSGATFASLVVAILCMLLSFAFVGITEQAKIFRIVLSGIIAGLGIVSMHYLGQIAIAFFVTKNKIGHVLGAIAIAVCAVTAALFIFFKLREQWENQWYKRLGCAMLMGLAVCGMHYTALFGTVYYANIDSDVTPPTPVMTIPTLIGIISAIVLIACILLFIIAVKSKIENDNSPIQADSRTRLILGLVFFDARGRMLVKVDGIVPMKEITESVPEDRYCGAFSAHHPIFARLFESTLSWSRHNLEGPIHQTNEHPIDRAFMSAATELAEELDFKDLSDLGHLFHSVLISNSIPKKSIFIQPSKFFPAFRRESIKTTWILSKYGSKETINEQSPQSLKGTTICNTTSTSEQAVKLDMSDDDFFEETLPRSSGSFYSQDEHIFLIRKIESEKDLVDLLSIGFRFAEPMFIAKKMGDKLQLPSEYLLSHFKDMLKMAEITASMNTCAKSSDLSLQQSLKNEEDVYKRVFVGLFTVIECEKTSNNPPCIIVDRNKPYTFPIVQINLKSSTGLEEALTDLNREQKKIILNMSGQSLAKIASTTSATQQSLNSINHISAIKNDDKTEHISTTSSTYIQELEGPNQRFFSAFQEACETLANLSQYDKHLTFSAKLSGDIIDIPCFALRPGPCSLILFRARIALPETQHEINSPNASAFKCIPFSVYHSFSAYATDNAVQFYRKLQLKNNSPPSCLLQQQLYQSTASKNTKEDPLVTDAMVKEQISSTSTQQVLSSLPPPPRAKRNKFSLTPSTPYTETDMHVNKSFLPNIIKNSDLIPLASILVAR